MVTLLPVLLAVALARPQLLEAATHAPPPWGSLRLRRGVGAQQDQQQAQQVQQAQPAVQLAPSERAAPKVLDVPSSAAPDRASPAPSLANELEAQPPSKCVWAIVTCCTPSTAAIRYSCFELLSCPGAFWDGSPCEPAVASAALRHASKFYSSGGARGTPAGRPADDGPKRG